VEILERIAESTLQFVLRNGSSLAVRDPERQVACQLMEEVEAEPLGRDLVVKVLAIDEGVEIVLGR